MIYYKLLAIIDLLFVGFVMRVTLGELKEENDWVLLLIEIDKNTDFLR